MNGSPDPELKVIKSVKEQKKRACRGDLVVKSTGCSS